MIYHFVLLVVIFHHREKAVHPFPGVLETSHSYLPRLARLQGHGAHVRGSRFGPGGSAQVPEARWRLLPGSSLRRGFVGTVAGHGNHLGSGRALSEKWWAQQGEDSIGDGWQGAILASESVGFEGDPGLFFRYIMWRTRCGDLKYMTLNTAGWGLSHPQETG